MACHPSGVTVDIVGINASDHGRNCEVHKACGSVLELDSVVRFRVVQLDNGGTENCANEETAIAAYHVTGGIDCCRVGFLRRHLLKYKEEYDGRLAQVTDVLGEERESPSDRHKHRRNKGCCRAVLIEAEYRDYESPVKKHKAQESD